MAKSLNKQVLCNPVQMLSESHFSRIQAWQKKGRMIPKVMGQEASELGTNLWTIVRPRKIRNHFLPYTAGLDMTSLAKTNLSRILFSRKTKSRATVDTSSEIEGGERSNRQMNIFSLHGSTATGKF